MKLCKKCEETKDESYFRKSRNSCRSCESASSKKWQKENAEAKKIYDKEYSKNNKKRIKEKNKNYYSENKSYFKEKKKEWTANNKAEIAEYAKAYAIKNKDKIREWQKLYSRNRYNSDEVFRLKVNLKTRMKIYCKSKGFEKGGLVETLGCSWEEFKTYIESKWSDGMSWDNYKKDGWHLDHIIPLASAKTREEVNALFHYSNLQPLWAEDNYKKGSKIL